VPATRSPRRARAGRPRLPHDTDRLAKPADCVTNGAADESTDEGAPQAAARLELPGRDDLVVDASILQGVLREADHLGF
jgi:hypothetical protein